jgi:hypothetical protein
MRKGDEALWKLAILVMHRIEPLVQSSLGPHILNSVSGVKRKPKLALRPTPSQEYWLKWFREIVEIHTSISRLGEALTYLGQYPATRVFRFHGISEATWIRYHVEMYLQEEYILFNRLRGFLKRAERVSSKASNPDGAKIAGNLLAWTSKAFDPVIKTRGTHVHKSRLQDRELRDLDLFILLATHATQKKRAFMRVRHLQAEQTKISWKRRLYHGKKNIRELCTRIFTEITPILIGSEPRS